MWSRRALAAAALATILSCPAGAQIEDSALEQVDPWGVGYLTEDEPAFRTRMWRGTPGESLLPLVQAARTQGLTPGERMLLRRLALSPARAPAGEASHALLAERARLAFELGEAKSAAGQFSRLPPPPEALTEDGAEHAEPAPPPPMDPAAMAADLNLVLGNEATACDAVSAPHLEGTYWAKLRAVCAALAGNTSGAELAMEMAQAQGVKDSWLAAAIFATSGATPNPPRAKFDTGLEYAMSARAMLEMTPDMLPEERPDIAAALARQKLTPPAVRVRAASIAAEAGLITADEYRIAYNSALAADGFAPTTALDRAIFVSSDALSTNAEKAEALATALKATAGEPARFDAVSGLLQFGIARLPVDAETEAQAILFARAAIAAGDLAEAARWIAPPEPEEPVIAVSAETPAGPETEPPDGAPENLLPAELPEEPEVEPPPPEPELPSFDVAWLQALMVLADPEPEAATIEETARTLMAIAESRSEKRTAARLFALWTIGGTAPPAAARAWLAEESETAAKNPGPGKALAVLAAARSGTAAEVVVSTLALTDGDPSKLETSDLAILAAALEDVGAGDAARQLALEASGYWKARK